MRFSQLPSRPLPFLFCYVRARPAAFAALALFITGAAGCAVAVQYGMKLIVDAMSGFDRTDAGVWRPLAFFLGLIAIESGLWRLSGWLGCRTIVATCADIRVDLFDYLTGHAWTFFNRHMSGSLGTRISSAASSSAIIFSTLVWNVAPPCVEFVGATIVLFTIDWRVACALVIFVILTAAAISLFGARGQRLHEAYGMHSARVGGEIVDTVSNIWAVHAFTARRMELERLASHVSLEAQAQRRSWMYTEKARVLHDVLLWLTAGSMLAFAIHAWQAGQMTTGDVVVVSALVFRVLHGSRDLALALISVAQQSGVVAEMLSTIGQPHALIDAPHARAYVVREGSIEFRNVAYSYRDGCEVLSGFNLRIPAGQTVGIAGPSGAGKSTLLGLLQRFDDVTEGEITLDGQAVKSIKQECLHDAFAVVPQDIRLFRRTIMENLRYGRQDATDKEVYEAARLANCDEFIRRLPNGYATVLSERGASLSGGQRQRISIARAFLKNAPILLLDEVTSSLDSRSEASVQEGMARLMQNRTVIAVSHKLSTLSTFDRIVVLEHGRIVQDGSPDALLQQGGMFRTLLYGASESDVLSVHGS